MDFSSYVNTDSSVPVQLLHVFGFHDFPNPQWSNTGVVLVSVVSGGENSGHDNCTSHGWISSTSGPIGLQIKKTEKLWTTQTQLFPTGKSN